jgi:hypothetical protein
MLKSSSLCLYSSNLGTFWLKIEQFWPFEEIYPRWPPLLKIEHMVKLQVFGNNSKTVSNIKNLTWVKNDLLQNCRVGRS